MNSNRQNILFALVGFDEDIEKLERDVGGLEWDAQKPLVTVSLDNVTSVLQRHLSGSLLADDVIRWSELIENREDIAFAIEHNDLIRDAIYKLANAELHGSSNESVLGAVYRQLIGL